MRRPITHTRDELNRKTRASAARAGAAVARLRSTESAAFGAYITYCLSQTGNAHFCETIERCWNKKQPGCCAVHAKAWAVSLKSLVIYETWQTYSAGGWSPGLSAWPISCPSELAISMTTSLELPGGFHERAIATLVDRVRQELSDPSHETRPVAQGHARTSLTLDAMDERALASFELGPREQNAKRTTGPIRWHFLPPARPAAAAAAVAATHTWARPGGRTLKLPPAQHDAGLLRDTALNEQFCKAERIHLGDL